MTESPLDMQPEKRPETPGEQQRRRAREGLDRRGLHQVLIAMVIIFGGMASLVAADVVGVERYLTTVTVSGFIDRSTMKRSHECVTELMTASGEARIYTRNFCSFASWHIGDKAEVVARRLRFTRTIVVSTRGTIFNGAHTILPES
jgi:hypothetical protein